jgi:hypothetical protein
MPSRQSLADGVRERARALEQFAVWDAAHPSRPSPSAALDAIGTLYELLPHASRQRPPDPAGVMMLHKTLERASRRSAGAKAR